MSGWARTMDGWAMNLDGSDGLLVFALPRLELQSSHRGWRGVLLLPDGRRREWACAPGVSLVAAKASAVEAVRHLMAPPRGDEEIERGAPSPIATKGGPA